MNAFTHVLLTTAIVFIQNEQTSNNKQYRVLLDSGSISNYISKNVFDELNAQTSRVYDAISGVGITNQQMVQEINYLFSITKSE